MRRLAALAAAVSMLVLVPVAQGTQRFAAPAGTGTECTQAEPCSLNEAVQGAKGGDEVIVKTGTYTPNLAIFAPPAATNVQIHGEAGAPMPKIVPSFSGAVFFVTQPGDSVSYLEIEDNSNGATGLICVSARVERVRVRLVGSTGIGINAITDCLIRNSVFLVEGLGALAIRGGSSNSTNSAASVRNVTAIASGANSIGASSEYFQPEPGGFTLEIQNSIVQGAEADLKPRMGAFGNGDIAVSHSNFDKTAAPPEGEEKVIDGGGNQSAPPLFVSAENRDYSEAPGSPTIDAGLAGELGPLDLAGSPRVQGAAPDIGAFEATPPPAPPAGRLESLAVKPKKFRAGNVSGAVASRKKRAPLGATVSYSLSAAGSVEFHVEHAGIGRKVGGKCVKQTRGNRRRKSCVIYRPVKGRFSVQGAAGGNSFRFSGKVGGRALKPGLYRLVGSAGNAIIRAPFTIVK
jgi:hypothetical protein